MSRFYPGAHEAPAQGQQSDLWLSLEPQLLSPQLRKKCEQGCLLALDFIGRRTAVEGSYGHMGLAKHLIVVDRVIGARPLG
jgi:hypothetical protein